MLYAQLNPANVVINIIDDAVHEVSALNVVPITSATPTAGQIYDPTTKTFADDPARAAHQFDQAKLAALDSVVVDTAAKIAAGATWQAHSVACDDSAATKMLGVLAAGAAAPYPITWVATDGTLFQIPDQATFSLFYGTMFAARAAIEEAAVALSAAIQNASDAASLAKVLAGS